MADISNREDIMDSRDIISRIEELEDERDLYEPQSVDDGDEVTSEDWAEANPEDAEELEHLKSFASELENYGDWEHGATVIRESYFTEYAEDLVKEVGDMPSEIPGYIVINWEATADNLKVDYTEADFDGVTYFMRA